MQAGGPIAKTIGHGTEEEYKPESVVLLPAYPNSFNPAAQIAFGLLDARADSYSKRTGITNGKYRLLLDDRREN